MDMVEENVETPVTAPGKKWYAVRTITGHEKRVKNYLDTEITELALENKISQVLIPEEKVFEVSLTLSLKSSNDSL